MQAERIKIFGVCISLSFTMRLFLANTMREAKKITENNLL